MRIAGERRGVDILRELTTLALFWFYRRLSESLSIYFNSLTVAVPLSLYSNRIECREEGSIAPFGSPGHDAYSLAAFNSQRPRWMIDHETLGLGG